MLFVWDVLRICVSYLPTWIFLPASVLYFELMLHKNAGAELPWANFVYIFLFSICIGLLLSLLTGIAKKKKTNRIITCVILGVLTFLFLFEHFIFDSFKVFMNFSDVATGAGHVAGNFMSTIGGIITHGVLPILLYLIPLVLYILGGVFCGWGTHAQTRRYLVVPIVAFALFCGALLRLNGDTLNKTRYEAEYRFDTAVRSFGYLTALRLDISSKDAKTGFVIDDPQKDSTEPSATAPAESDPQATEPEKPVVYGYNKMDIDFASLAESSSGDIAELNSYVASLTPSKQNAYTGLFKGKNLIFITAEAFSAEVIDPVLTPTLYRMQTKGIYFKDYYQPAWGGSTSTGEYSNLMGLVPTNGVASMTDTIGHNLYLTIGNQLQRLGYFSRAYHDGSYKYYDRHLTHENFGYEKFIGMGNGMEEGVESVWPESDLEMVQFTLDQYVNHQPFSVYYMTVSGHCPYVNTAGNHMTLKNYSKVENLDASDYVKSYIACNLELEYAMQYLIQELERLGIADDTVIVLGTDHYPYGLTESTTWATDKDYLSELYGYEPDDCFKQDHSALLLWSGCLEKMDPIEIDTPTYSLDILPTLSNLFGVEYDSRLLIGRDVFSDAEPLTIWGNYSWKTDRCSYNAQNGKLTWADGVEPDSDYVDRIKGIVRNKIRFSDLVLEDDYYGALFGKQS